MRRVTWSSILWLGVALPAGAQSVTTATPDTTDAAQVSTPLPDSADVPIWLGIQFAPIVLATSELDGSERTSAQNCTPWFGVGAAFPWTSTRHVWIDAGYQHWEFAGEFDPRAISGAFIVPRIDPLTLDEFGLRFGVDEWLGRPDRLAATLGLGLGLGSGWAQAPGSIGSNVLVTGELIAHALVHVGLGGRLRLGIGVTGAAAYVSAENMANGWWEHLEFAVRLDRQMRRSNRTAGR